MSRYYFAYGSNMNVERMATRGLAVVAATAGILPRMRLVFTKRATDAPHRSYANIAFAPDGQVEGVLYELASAAEINKMDPFEGSPWRYSRDVFSIQTAAGNIPAWVYVANQAMLANDLKPARWYLEHLLAGKAYLSSGYYEWLTTVQCLESESVDHHGGLLIKKNDGLPPCAVNKCE